MAKKAFIRFAAGALVSIGAAAQVAVREPHRDAYLMLFQVARALPAPHWSNTTRQRWLEHAGLDARQTNILINAANTCFVQLQNQGVFEKRDSQALDRLIATSVGNLRNSIGATAALDRLVGGIESQIEYQGRDRGVAVYTAMALTEDGQVAAAAVSAVLSHEHPARVTVSLRSPDGRIVSSAGADAIISEATVQLPLCATTGCHDGRYQSTANPVIGTIGGAATGLPSKAELNVGPFVSLRSVTGSPAEILSHDSEATVAVEAWKSDTCSAGGLELQLNLTPMPASIAIEKTPHADVRWVPFRGSRARARWAVRTRSDNETAGTIQPDGLINSANCRAQGPLVIQGDPIRVAAP
jgi:hypothetical protein